VSDVVLLSPVVDYGETAQSAPDSLSDAGDLGALSMENRYLRLKIDLAVAQGVEAAALADGFLTFIQRLLVLMEAIGRTDCIQSRDRADAERAAYNSLRDAARATVPRYTWPAISKYPTELVDIKNA
jgi:hypothetical protein